jgi:hypothetical protein
MLCPKCGKESNNLRVCGFCHTPYAVEDSARKPKVDLSRGKRWAAIGVLAAFTAGFYLVERDPRIPANVVMPSMITVPMTPIEANGMLTVVNRWSHVDVRDGVLTVQVLAKTFPERRAGQLALAQQYARADEIVQGHKRVISFLDPSGAVFARADPEKGVVMTR